jgi:hypothetical protein
MLRTLQGEIDSQGALVDVLIGLAGVDVQKRRLAGQPIPTSISCRALLDTGADASCIDRGVLQPLIHVGLKHQQLIYANLPAVAGLHLAAEYLTSLTVLHPSGDPRSNFVVRNFPIVEQPLGALGYEFLLGRDVLAHCLLVCDGPGRRLTLGY